MAVADQTQVGRAERLRGWLELTTGLNLAVSYPNIFRNNPALPAAVTPEPPANVVDLPQTPTAVISEKPVGSSGTRKRLQSTQDLIDLGRLTLGDVLSIRGREDSSARVLDGRHVEFKGERITFNEWGQRVTGWPSIRIYTMACLADGRTLDQLRDQPGPGDSGT